MFSYLHGRRPNVRRNTPSSGSASQQPVRRIHEPTSSSEYEEEVRHWKKEGDSAFAERKESTTSNPYVLPPIPRVASQHEPSRFEVRWPLESTSNSMAESMTQGEKYGEESPLEGHSYTCGHSTNQTEHLPQSSSVENGWQKSYTNPAEAQASACCVKSNQLSPQSILSVRTVVTPSESTASLQSPKILLTESTSSHSEHPPRHARTKLNLLNPMSLLARRRSAQTSTQASEYLPPSKHSPILSTPRDDYDPRIRGTGVHDFSAPRRKPTPSSTGDSNTAAQSMANTITFQDLDPHRFSHSPARAEKEHTPVFKEQFEFEKEPWRFVGDERKDQQTRSIMNHMHARTFPDHELSSLPAFARNLPGNVSCGLRTTGSEFVCAPNLPLEEVLEDTPLNTSPSSTPQKPSPPKSPPKSRSRATSITDPSYQSTAGPKRFASNASRFSFDLAGVGSAAQEKLLEDRHRQQAAQRARSSTLSGLSISGLSTGDNDDFDYDNMDELEELEERIPGVNADIDDEPSPSLDRSKHSSPLRSPVASIASTSYTSIDSPRDVPHLSATTLPNTSYSETKLSSVHDHRNEAGRQKSLVRYELKDSVPHPGLRLNMASDQAPVSKMIIPYDENDFYFDDGVIDDLEEEPDSTFDESIFDDETNRVYGIPIRDLPRGVMSDDFGAPPQELADGGEPSRGLPYIKPPRTLADMLEFRNAYNENTSPLSPSYDQSAGLTQDNLTAYHDALAQATMQAAETGKFVRRASDVETDQSSPRGELLRKVTFNETSNDRGSKETPTLVFDMAGFSFDDNLEDDSIIAAANAEALENDEEGFYGQEFGFYARADKSGSAEYANGGYFGTAGADGLRRSHSGRADFQEPSLTPITERSEWSNRNSMVSYPQSLPTPGLAQLVGNPSYDEENMTLSALRKLRRGVFGGSNVSLPSSSDSPKSGSPHPNHPLISSFTPGGILANEYPSSNRASSSHGLINEYNTEMSPPASPTLTLQTMGFPQAERPDSSPKRRHAVKGHSRNNSTGESVSYVKEVDDDGAGRWILERRRTMESGQVEILGRQVVEGGI